MMTDERGIPIDLGTRKSLGDAVEEIYGASQGQHFLRGCRNWILLLATLDWFELNGDGVVHITPPENAPCFVGNGLTEVQKVSLRLLREWWNAEIQNPLFSTAASEVIYRGGKAFDILENGDGAEGLPFIHKVKYTYDKFTIDNRLIDDTLISQSQYHQQLFYLWIVEFCLIEHPLKADQLHTQRRVAAYMAASQRVAWSCFERYVMGDQTGGPRLAGYDHAAFIISTGRPSPNLKRTFSTTINQGPWLKPKRYRKKDNKGGLPFCLWDIMRGKTVMVQNIPQRPSYTVVSHSWCRGIIKDAPLIKVAGVPWCVPQNSLFNVEDLPMVLRARAIADGFTPYLWIDVLCVPPECATNGHLPAIRVAELCRQEQIFRNADEGMIWFHGARDWRGLEHSVLWLAAQFLHESQGHFDGPLGFVADRFESIMELIELGAFGPTNLFEAYEYTGSQSTEKAALVGWFTSLCALQEMYFRPDMRFVDKNWRTFSVGPQNLIVTLESLVSLAQCYYDLRFPTNPENPLENLVPRTSAVTTVTLGPKSKWYYDDLGQWHTRLFEMGNLGHARIPRGAGEILSAFWRSRLDKILDPRHLDPLLMANQRFCVRRRAEAIMAITACTNWYLDYFVEYLIPPPRGEKVLDRFPLAFLEEFRGRLGAQLFSTWRPAGEHCVEDVMEQIDENYVMVRTVGSMLPFCRSTWRSKEEWRFPLLSEDNSFVSTWRILQDGSCLLRIVTIIAQHQPHGDEHADEYALPAEIKAHQCLADGRCVNRLTADLGGFLRKYSPNRAIYAVALSEGPTFREHVGIILQEVTRPAGILYPMYFAMRAPEYNTEETLLVKVGVFRLIGSAPMHELLPTDVSWRVL